MERCGFNERTPPTDECDDAARRKSIGYRRDAGARIQQRGPRQSRVFCRAVGSCYRKLDHHGSRDAAPAVSLLSAIVARCARTGIWRQRLPTVRVFFASLSLCRRQAFLCIGARDCCKRAEHFFGDPGRNRHYRRHLGCAPLGNAFNQYASRVFSRHKHHPSGRGHQHGRAE